MVEERLRLGSISSTGFLTFLPIGPTRDTESESQNKRQTPNVDKRAKYNSVPTQVSAERKQTASEVSRAKLRVNDTSGSEKLPSTTSLIKKPNTKSAPNHKRATALKRNKYFVLGYLGKCVMDFSNHFHSGILPQTD